MHDHIQHIPTINQNAKVEYHSHLLKEAHSDLNQTWDMFCLVDFHPLHNVDIQILKYLMNMKILAHIKPTLSTPILYVTPNTIHNVNWWC